MGQERLAVNLLFITIYHWYEVPFPRLHFREGGGKEKVNFAESIPLLNSNNYQSCCIIKRKYNRFILRKQVGRHECESWVSNVKILLYFFSI